MQKKIARLLILAFAVWLVATTNTSAQGDLRIGGYAQTWLIFNQHEEMIGEDFDTWGFRLRRARLTAQTTISDVLSVATWLEFAGRRNILLDLIVTANFSPKFTVRLGQYRPPTQMYDTGVLSSSGLIFYERSAISSRLSGIMGHEAFRDIGIMAVGTLGPVWYGVHIGNGMGRFTQAGTNISSRDFGGGLFGGRVDITPIDGLIIGGHFSTNQQSNVITDGSAPYDIDRTSYSIRLATDGLMIPGLFTHLELGGGSVDDTDEFDFDGYYLYAGYRISPDWSILARYDYYKEAHVNDTTTDEDNITLGVLYFWRQNNREVVRMGANYSFGDRDPGSLSRNTFLIWFQIRFLP